MRAALAPRAAAALATCALALVALVAPPSASAQNIDAGYGTITSNQFLLGLNGFLTFPFDMVALSATPPEEFEELPGAVVTSHVVGFFAGTMLSLYRGFTGLADLLLAPLPMEVSAIGPEPRVALFHGLWHDEVDEVVWICDQDGWGEEAESGWHRLGVIRCGLSLPPWKGSTLP